MTTRLLQALQVAGKGIYCGVGQAITALRLWNCQVEIERLEARRRRIDAQSRSVILKRVYLGQLADDCFARVPVTPPRGVVPVLVRSMGRVVNG